MPRRTRKDPYAAEFGRLIRTLREERRWTLVELARRTHMNVNSISNLDKGDNIPSIYALAWLGRAFGMPSWELLREVENALSAKAKAAAAPKPNSFPPLPAGEGGAEGAR